MNHLKSLRRLILAALPCLRLGVGSGPVQAAENVFEALPDAIDACGYGYPMVTVEVTRRVISEVPRIANDKIMRWPKGTPPSILDGPWTIPPVNAVE